MENSNCHNELVEYCKSIGMINYSARGLPNTVTETFGDPGNNRTSHVANYRANKTISSRGFLTGINNGTIKS